MLNLNEEYAMLKSISLYSLGLGLHNFSFAKESWRIMYSRKSDSFHSLSKASLTIILSLIFMRNKKKTLGEELYHFSYWREKKEKNELGSSFSFLWKA